MKAAAVAGAVLLAGCGASETPQVVEQNVAAVEPVAPAVAPTPAQPARQIGQTSTLNGATSNLTGQVSGFAVTVTDTSTIVELAADTLFAFDKADLAPEAQGNLTKTADLIRKGGAGAVAITGYTDAKGTDDYNLDLSQRRAAAVAGWLKTQPGLADRSFTTTGKGKADPVAPNARPDGSDDPDGRARNRRVVVTIPK